MMPGTIKGRSTLAIALATGLALGGAGFGAATAQAQANSKKQAQASPFSPGFQAAAGPLQQKMEAAMALHPKAVAGDAAAKAQLQAALVGVPAMLAQAEAAAKTPQDKLLAGQFALNLGVMTNDARTAERGARAMLASGQLNPTQTTQVQQTLTRLSAVGQGDQVLQQVDALAKANNPQGALAELRKAVAARPAGQPVPAAWLARATQIAVNGNLPSDSIYWASRQVELYPNNLNWLTAAQVVRKYARLEAQESLDLFRLMSRSGAFSNEGRLVATDYRDYAEIANLRGAYSEVVKTIDQGVAAGALTSAGRMSQLRSSANGRIAADRASLAAQERDARAAPSGVPALAVADLYLGFGQAAKAEELYRLAIQKGGARFDSARAMTGLGIALSDQGRYAEARDSFAKVTGPQRQPLARLWQIYVAQKDPATASRAG